MSQPPSTTVKVPASAMAYTPATLDPELRSQINSLLLREGHVNKLSDTLLHSLNADPSNWPSLIQQHALTLLRSGEVSTFPALIQRVLNDIRQDTAGSSSSTNAEGTNGKADDSGTTTTNGTTNGDGAADKKAVNGTSSTGSGNNGANLAIPPAVVEAVLKTVKESLDTICEPTGGGGSN